MRYTDHQLIHVLEKGYKLIILIKYEWEITLNAKRFKTLSCRFYTGILLPLRELTVSSS